jgi:hypothetical protein
MVEKGAHKYREWVEIQEHVDVEKGVGGEEDGSSI